jgi:hypothetical protein
MEPGRLDESLPATLAGTNIRDCVLEAVATLGAPEELRRLRGHFDDDPVCREWGFDGYYFKGPKALLDPGVWVQKICDRLHVNYPDGPFWGMEESCL